MVTFGTPEEAAAAIAALNGQELGSRRLHVREDRTRIDAQDGVAVFVGNLPWACTTEQLAPLFAVPEPFDVHVKRNMAGRSRGFAILRCVCALFLFFKPPRGALPLSSEPSHPPPSLEKTKQI